MVLSLSMSGSSSSSTASSSSGSSGSSSSGSSSEDEQQMSPLSRQDDGSRPEPPLSPPPPPPPPSTPPPPESPPPSSAKSKAKVSSRLRAKPATTAKAKSAPVRKAPVRKVPASKAKRPATTASSIVTTVATDEEGAIDKQPKVKAVRKPARRKPAATAATASKPAAPGMSRATLQRRKRAAALAAAQLASAEGDHTGDDDDMETDSLYGAARSDNDDELFLDNFDDDLDDEYSGESDVFEDDFEALEYYELARERALGIDDCMVEMKSTTQPQDTAFPYPRYLAKLPELISENSVFGKDVVQYLYCNNLTYNPDQLAVLEARNLKLETQKLVDAKRMAQLKQQEIKARELQNLRENIALAMAPPLKKQRLSETSFRALETVSSAPLLPQRSTNAKAIAAANRRARKKAAALAAAAAAIADGTAPPPPPPPPPRAPSAPKKRPPRPRKKPVPSATTGTTLGESNGTGHNSASSSATPVIRTQTPKKRTLSRSKIQAPKQEELKAAEDALAALIAKTEQAEAAADRELAERERRQEASFSESENENGGLNGREDKVRELRNAEAEDGNESSSSTSSSSSSSTTGSTSSSSDDEEDKGDEMS